MAEFGYDAEMKVGSSGRDDEVSLLLLQIACNFFLS